MEPGIMEPGPMEPWLTRIGPGWPISHPSLSPLSRVSLYYISESFRQSEFHQIFPYENLLLNLNNSRTLLSNSETLPMIV
jgi:hypothetical protein